MTSAACNAGFVVYGGDPFPGLPRCHEGRGREKNEYSNLHFFFPQSRFSQKILPSLKFAY